MNIVLTGLKVEYSRQESLHSGKGVHLHLNQAMVCAGLKSL